MDLEVDRYERTHLCLHFSVHRLKKVTSRPEWDSRLQEGGLNKSIVLVVLLNSSLHFLFRKIAVNLRVVREIICNNILDSRTNPTEV